MIEDFIALKCHRHRTFFKMLDSGSLKCNAKLGKTYTTQKNNFNFLVVMYSCIYAESGHCAIPTVGSRRKVLQP